MVSAFSFVVSGDVGCAAEEAINKLNTEVVRVGGEDGRWEMLRLD